MKNIFAIAIGISVIAGPVHSQSASDGENAFRQCAACHKVGDNARNSRGPVLNSVVGRAAGTVAGYRYSNSMQAAGEAGLVWTEENLLDYLANPTGFLRIFLGDSGARANMGLSVRKEADRRDIIAYLSTL